MAAAAQERKAEYDSFRFRMYRSISLLAYWPMMAAPFAYWPDGKVRRELVVRPSPLSVLDNSELCDGFSLLCDSPETESTHNSKGNASLRASMIDDYPGTQDPNGTGIGLAIDFVNGGAYHAVNDHTLNRNYWSRAPVNGGSPGPKMWQLRRDSAAIGNLKKHIEGLPAAAAATFTKERVKIGLPLSLAAFEHSPTARVSEAANPGGATVRLDLDSGASIHAVGEARIMRDIQLFSFDMWAMLPDNSRQRIIGKGTIEMNGCFSIPNVYLVEGLRKNLISVSQLDRYHAMCCCFHGRQCTVMIPGGDVVGGAILEDDGMYQLRFLQVPQPEE